MVRVARAALSETPFNSAKGSLVRTQCLLCPRGIFTDARTATLLRVVDTSLLPVDLVADSVKRSSRTRVFCSLPCEIASAPRKVPTT